MFTFNFEEINNKLGSNYTSDREVVNFFGMYAGLFPLSQQKPNFSAISIYSGFQ